MQIEGGRDGPVRVHFKRILRGRQSSDVVDRCHMLLGSNMRSAVPPPLASSPLWFAIALLVGIAGFIRGFRMLQRRRLILDVPRSKVRSAAVGSVELSGQAVGPYSFPAPATGEDCFLHWTIGWH